MPNEVGSPMELPPTQRELTRHLGSTLQLLTPPLTETSFFALSWYIKGHNLAGDTTYRPLIPITFTTNNYRIDEEFEEGKERCPKCGSVLKPDGSCEADWCK
ncbi:hypothetical protein GQ53DRAFT_828606 [Thozetella sp. PMI_491]|nr:hypothetical protein GQ53DRAFT_828606 [Thozetella sp. PMI_491]